MAPAVMFKAQALLCDDATHGFDISFILQWLAENFLQKALNYYKVSHSPQWKSVNYRHQLDNLN